MPRASISRTLLVLAVVSSAHALNFFSGARKAAAPKPVVASPQENAAVAQFRKRYPAGATGVSLPEMFSKPLLATAEAEKWRIAKSGAKKRIMADIDDAVLRSAFRGMSTYYGGDDNALSMVHPVDHLRPLLHAHRQTQWL